MGKNWKTKLIHSDARIPEGFRSLSTPVHRGSTVLFPSAEAVQDTWDQYAVGYTYGLYGTPTTLELAARICELERGYRTFITPGGQGAIALINFAFLKAGDHVLVPEMNTGQFKTVLRDQYLVDAKPLNKISGQPFRIAEIEAAIEGMLA